MRRRAIREDIHRVLFRVFTEQVEIHSPVLHCLFSYRKIPSHIDSLLIR